MVATVRDKYETLAPMMNEKMRRRWAACEAMAKGRGGISAVARETGPSRNTIMRGIREIEAEMPGLANTRYVRKTITAYEPIAVLEEARIRESAASDGIFPLITDEPPDRLTALELLQIGAPRRTRAC